MENKWIDVDKALPENFTSVLVAADFVGITYMAEIYTVGCYQIDHWTTDRDSDLDCDYVVVNSWMHIPELPVYNSLASGRLSNSLLTKSSSFIKPDGTK